MTHMLAELEDIQVQLALLKAETNQKLANIQEEASHKLAPQKPRLHFTGLPKKSRSALLPGGCLSWRIRDSIWPST